MHVHQSLAQGRQERLLRPRRPVLPLGDREGVHRRAAQARARDRAAVRPVGQLLQAARARATRRPTYLAWSRRNRSALIRVPLYHPGKEAATRAELRCPDPACNPYLCFAGMLHAGLEGIENGYELPEPMEQNLYHLTPEEREKRGIEELPETLGEAIEIAAHSELVLRDPRRAHLQALHRDQAPGVGRVSRPGDPLGDRALPPDPLRAERQGARRWPGSSGGGPACRTCAAPGRWRTGSRSRSRLTSIAKLEFEGRA